MPPWCPYLVFCLSLCTGVFAYISESLLFCTQVKSSELSQIVREFHELLDKLIFFVFTHYFSRFNQEANYVPLGDTGGVPQGEAPPPATFPAFFDHPRNIISRVPIPASVFLNSAVTNRDTEDETSLRPRLSPLESWVTHGVTLKRKIGDFSDSLKKKTGH